MKSFPIHQFVEKLNYLAGLENKLRMINKNKLS